MSARSTKSLEILIANESSNAHPNTIPEESDTYSTLSLVESEGKGLFFYFYKLLKNGKVVLN